MAERSGVASSALRFYESRGLISSRRTEGNQRRFRRSTLRRVAIIRAAQAVGLSLDDVAAAIERLPHDKELSLRDWGQLSRSWRGLIGDRIASLERLRDELTSCIGCGCLSLQRCALFNKGDIAGRLGQGPRYLMGDTAAGAASFSAQPAGD